MLFRSNQRYADAGKFAEQGIFEDPRKQFVGSDTSGGSQTGGSSETETQPDAIKNPQGGLSDMSGGSGLQADITSAGYTGQAPPKLKPTAPGKNKAPTVGATIKRPPTGQNGPLIANQGTTS